MLTVTLLELLFKGWVSFNILIMATPFYECPKLDPLCREIPLERHDCKCVLTYSICKINIDLDRLSLLRKCSHQIQWVNRANPCIPHELWITLSTNFLTSWSNRWILKKISSLCIKCLHPRIQISQTHYRKQAS